MLLIVQQLVAYVKTGTELVTIQRTQYSQGNDVQVQRYKLNRYFNRTAILSGVERLYQQIYV